MANFLKAPSRILFAIVITPTINTSSPYDIIMSRCRPRVGHPSVAGDDWQTLDFGDIEEELAAKLTDDDISKVLLHIDAANKVKRLRLTNMVNITGAKPDGIKWAVYSLRNVMGKKPEDGMNNVMVTHGFNIKLAWTRGTMRYSGRSTRIRPWRRC